MPRRCGVNEATYVPSYAQVCYYAQVNGYFDEFPSADSAIESAANDLVTSLGLGLLLNCRVVRYGDRCPS